MSTVSAREIPVSAAAETIDHSASRNRFLAARNPIMSCCPAGSALVGSAGPRSFAQFGDRLRAPLMQALRDLCPGLRRDVLGRGLDGRGSVARRVQVRALRVGHVLQSRPAARIRFAGEQRLRNRSGRRNASARSMNSRTVLGAVRRRDAPSRVARYDEAEVAIFARQPQPIRQGLDERNAALLVSAVARPLLRRRRALAEIVHQRGRNRTVGSALSNAA